MGCTPYELFKKCEWWEILGLLYYKYERNILEQKYYREQKEQKEIEDKAKNGKLKMYYKKGMSQNLKNKLTGT